jgi:hypothetical protein
MWASRWEHDHLGASIKDRRRVAPNPIAGPRPSEGVVLGASRLLTLVRQWRGHTHTFLVREDGFV